MGAGILPATIHKGKLYFLFGKENKYEDSAPGFSDFGGGTDNNESLFDTAIREAGEELTGFLGNDNDIKKMLKKYGTYNIDHKTNGHSLYRMHIFPMEYDELLPFYYNNNQKFLQKRLDPNIIKKTKIFEKEEIRWVSIDEMKKMRGKFRFYFENIVDIMIAQKEEIRMFIERSLRSKTKSKKRMTKINKTKYNKKSKKNRTKRIIR
jgi:ADP-ribose pyrophosphatase YjhB (NUDIX family)